MDSTQHFSTAAAAATDMHQAVLVPLVGIRQPGDERLEVSLYIVVLAYEPNRLPELYVIFSRVALTQHVVGWQLRG